jgi:hypothetical protein
MDDIIVTAALGTSKTGENGSADTAFGAGQAIVASSVGMTVAKLREAKAIFMRNEVDTDNDQLYIALTSNQIEDLLATTEITSSDYNTVKALVQGQIDTFMGFKFVQIERLPKVSTTRTCFAWAKSGIHLGLWNDINTSIDKRADKSNAMQVYVKGTFGATRVEEGKVVSIAAIE